MKTKTKLEYVMSNQCRRPSAYKKAFLDWVNSRGEFRRRKPTVDEVVREARRKGSFLRSILEHNVKRAAMQQWRAEAQYYLRCIQVVRVNIVTREAITKPIRAWIPVAFGPNGTIPEDNYVPAQRVADDPTAKATVLERAHADFLAWLNRYERYDQFLEAFSPVIVAYRKLEAKFQKSLVA